MRSLENGDSEAWAFTFQLLWPVASSAARRRLQNSWPLDVEDVAITAIKEAAEEVEARQVHNFTKLKALTVVIANRRALDHIRHMQAERRTPEETDILEPRRDLERVPPDPFEQTNKHIVADLLASLMNKLPDRQSQLLKAYYLEGLTQAELAKKLGMKMGTVGVTLSRALESMREILQEYPQLMKELPEELR
jgi:RNA polymerase sigma factor (sigma-70 family)